MQYEKQNVYQCCAHLFVTSKTANYDKNKTFKCPYCGALLKNRKVRVPIIERVVK